MTGEQFSCWVRDLLQPWLASHAGPNYILLVDSASVHLSHQAVSAVRNVIETLYIPQNTTDVLQPMDLAVNKPFKDGMRRCWLEHVMAHLGSDILPRPTHKQLIDWVLRAWNGASRAAIKSGFSAANLDFADTGADIPLDSDPDPINLSIPADLLDEATSLLSKITFEDGAVEPQPPTL